MSRLRGRVEALEKSTGSHRPVFVARYRPDGSLDPLPDGEVYAEHVALMPASSATLADWMRDYAEPAKRLPAAELGDAMKVIHARAKAELQKVIVSSRRRGGLAGA